MLISIFHIQFWIQSQVFKNFYRIFFSFAVFYKYIPSLSKVQQTNRSLPYSVIHYFIHFLQIIYCYIQVTRQNIVDCKYNKNSSLQDQKKSMVYLHIL